MAQLYINQRINLLDVADDVEIDISKPYNRFIVTVENTSPVNDKTFSLVPKGLTSAQKDKMRNAVVEIVWLGTWGNKVGAKILTILGNTMGNHMDSGVLYFFYNRTTDTWEYIKACGCSNGSGSGSGVY